MKIRITKPALVYVILTTLALIHQAGVFNLYYLTSILISAFIFGWAVVSCSARRKSFVLIGSEIGYVARLLMLPWVVFIGYNFFLYASGTGYAAFIKSSFVQICFAPCIILGAIGSYYLFGKNTIRYFLYAVVLHYIVLLCYKMITLGPSLFFMGIASIVTNTDYSNPFEANTDLALALGILLVFYCDKFISNETSEKKHIFAVAILVILCGKRIELLSLIIICISSFLTKLLSERHRKIMQNIISISLIALMYFFVYLVISGIMSVYVYSHGINTMGRMKMWDYVAQYASFSVVYMGKGYSFSNLILEKNSVLTYMGRVYVLHSDVLKIFFDMGFLIFSFWLIYNLLYLPKKIRNKFGFRSGNLTWFVTIYLFILYLTDNCINYYACQTLYVLVILQSIRLERNVNVDKLQLVK